VWAGQVQINNATGSTFSGEWSAVRQTQP
jgi:hypothetical protein